MKKQKKHHFKYRDPESQKVEDNSNAKKSELKKVTKADSNKLIKRDLLRTFITISAFIILIIALFLIEQKTNLLKPLLSRFGL